MSSPFLNFVRALLGFSWMIVLTCVAADSDVVINEIMFHPPNDREDLQYVELFNRGKSPVDLSGWAFTKGIKFVFSANTTLAPESYLVVCRNKKAFGAQYGEGIPAVGDFSGQLSHRGERLELSNARGEAIDALRYSDREPWPTGADGYSAALERICPDASGQQAENWAASALPNSRRSSGTPGRRNDTHSANLPPVISAPRIGASVPGEKVLITAEVADADGVKAVTLLWRVPRNGIALDETAIPMQRITGDEKRGTFQAAIPEQPPDTLVRFRIKAVDSAGAVRLQPHPNEPRPTYSYSTFVNTNKARIAFGYVLNFSRPESERRYRPRGGPPVSTEPPRGDSAFIYVPPNSGAVQVFDHVAVRSRSGGSKVHFPKDRPFKGMTGINVIFENSPRRILSEPLAYEVYRLAGVPAPLTEHLRVWVDGRPQGYQLLIEQPNKSFLTRHGRDDTGNLYKLIWQGHGLVGQHEKKTHETGGHEDLVQVIAGLDQKSGDAQWEFIQRHMNVEEFASYYAVNQCIQNWDGFFNNYFAYHDTGDTGKWEMYPWDEDKTWGDFDGASAKYDWYEMPLSFGSSGGRPPHWNPFSSGNRQQGPFGGVSWWRPPGRFSGPLLANKEFRRRFLLRVRELCETTFTEEKLGPLINALENRLEPEIPVYAQLHRRDVRQVLQRFHSDIESFRNQVKHRRHFLQGELNGLGVAGSGRERGSRSIWPWLLSGTLLACAGWGAVIWRRNNKRRSTASLRPPPLPRVPPPLPLHISAPTPGDQIASLPPRC